MDLITLPGMAPALLVAFLMGQAYYPILLRTQPPTPPVPDPPAEPERDPGWCHAHNKHRDDEEDA